MNQGVEKDFMLTTLTTHLSHLDTKISEVEVQCSKGIYVSPHKWSKSREGDKNHVKETLQTSHQKITNRDLVLEEMKENVEVLNEVIGYHPISLQQIRCLLSFAVPHLHPNDMLGYLVILRLTLISENEIGRVSCHDVN